MEGIEEHESLFFNKLVTKGLQAISGNDRFFEGYLTVEIKDKQGEVTIVDELIKVLPIWMDRGAPITDTHSNRVIGKGINYQKTIYKSSNGEEFPAIKIIGKIHSNYELDAEIWSRIKSGEYKGLSFGGATKSNRTPFRMKDGSIAYSLKDLEHYEVAVCKDPAVPLALITDFNQLAKAATDGEELPNNKMLIKCSKWGCYVEKTEDKKEVELTEDGKKVFDEAEKYSRLEMYKGGIEIGCPNGDCKYKQVSKDPKTPHYKFCPSCGTNMKIGNDEIEKAGSPVPSAPYGSTIQRLRDYKSAPTRRQASEQSALDADEKDFGTDDYSPTEERERNTVAELNKVDLGSYDTFQGKVDALIAEGKSEESAKKIVGAFVKGEKKAADLGTENPVKVGKDVNTLNNQKSEQITENKKSTKKYIEDANYINLLIKNLVRTW